jgi:hypothetical protein
MGNIHTIVDVLSEERYEKAKLEASTASYGELDVGHGDTFYMTFPSIDLDKVLYKVLEEHYGAPITPIVAFLRLNTACLDGTQRIHSDRDILGDTPSHAAVYYITDDKLIRSGTAFYKHAVYGDYLPAGEDQDEKEYSDTSLWTITDIKEGKANSMVTYPANRFHSRYPHRAWGRDQTDGRLIWTAFFDI